MDSGGVSTLPTRDLNMLWNDRAELRRWCVAVQRAFGGEPEQR